MRAIIVVTHSPDLEKKKTETALHLVLNFPASSVGAKALVCSAL